MSFWGKKYGARRGLAEDTKKRLIHFCFGSSKRKKEGKSKGSAIKYDSISLLQNNIYGSSKGKIIIIIIKNFRKKKKMSNWRRRRGGSMIPFSAPSSASSSFSSRLFLFLRRKKKFHEVLCKIAKNSFFFLLFFLEVGWREKKKRFERKNENVFLLFENSTDH